MGCRQNKQQIDTGLPVYNMLVVGFATSGKTTIINSLKGISSPNNDTLQNQLQITSFNVGNQFKTIAFQVAGRAQITWHSYYSTAKLIMFVIDITKHLQEDIEKSKKILKQIDENIPQNGKIFVVINKMDLLSQKKNNHSNSIKNNENEQQQQQIDESAQVIKESESRNKNRQNNENLKYAKIVQDLRLDQLNHETFTFRCSAIKNQGVNQIIKKLAAVVQ